MPQIINTNVAALTSQRNLNSSQNALATSLQRLSSGLRINSAKDDAAGLAISTRLTSQVLGLNQAGRNANDAISLSQTAEGGLTTVSDALNRIRELAIQSANGTNTATDRAALQAEALQLTNEIQRVATTTQFNGLNILDGTLGAAQFQVGANAGQTLSFSVGNSQTSVIGNYGFAGQSGGSSNSVAPAAATAVATTANNRVGATNLTLTANGVANTIATVTGQTTKSVAAAFNALTTTTGVTALAKTLASLRVVATGNVNFTIGGSSTAVVGATVSSTTDLSALADSINAQSAVTGVFASSTGSQISLTNSEGDNISITNFTNSNTNGSAIVTGSDAWANASAGSTIGLQASGGASTDSTTVAGSLKLNSANVFTLTGNNSTGGFVTNTSAQNSSLAAVSTLNISTLTGANDAIAIVDSALTQISTIRANLGALQNRFSTTISNLQIASENASASRSRIQDADFAAETTNLSRSQILQQAGIASLAQANALPNNVLALLQ